MNEIDVKYCFIRVLKAIATVLFVIFGCVLVLYSPLLSFLLNSFDSYYGKEVLSILILVCYYVLPFVFYVLFQEADERKLRLALKHRTRPGLGTVLKDSLSSVDFYINAVPLVLILLLLFDPGIYPFGILPSFFLKGIFQKFLASVLFYGVPVFFFLLLAEAFLRKDWYRQWRFAGFSVDSEDGLAEIPTVSKKRLTLHIALICVTVLMLPSVIVYYQVARILFALLLESPAMRVYFVLAVLVLVFLPNVQNFFGKKAFLKKLEEHCRWKGYSFGRTGRLHNGIFACSQKTEFVLETGKEILVGTFLPVRSKFSTLYVDNESTYRFERRIIAWYFTYPYHKIGFSPVKEEGGKPVRRIVLTTREPKSMRRGDEDVSREIWSGDSVGDFSLWCYPSFFSWLSRQDPIRK